MPARCIAIAATGPPIPPPMMSASTVLSFLRFTYISIFESPDRRRICAVSSDRQALIAAVGHATQAYQRATDGFDDEVGRVLGLNPSDLRCLDWLTERAMTAGELAESTGLSSAATTTLLDRLEQKGFVRRVRDNLDRRKVSVELTRTGVGILQQLYGPLAQEGACAPRSLQAGRPGPDQGLSRGRNGSGRPAPDPCARRARGRRPWFGIGSERRTRRLRGHTKKPTRRSGWASLSIWWPAQRRPWQC